MNIKRIIILIITTTLIIFAMLSASSCDFVKFVDDTPRSSLSDESETTDMPSEIINETTSESVTEPPIERVLAVNPKFNNLLSLNKNVVGDIKIDNTGIWYPIVFDGTNEYYLKRDFYGRNDKYGSIFMDMTNHGALLSKNTILHGHNFSDGRMFGDLEKFKQEDFFNSNKTVIFNNLYSDMEWEIFSVYVIHADDYFLLSAFQSDEDFFAFIERVKSISIFWRDYTPSADDYILSLHTCSYEFDDAHTIVHARLVSKIDNWEE